MKKILLISLVFSLTGLSAIAQSQDKVKTHNLLGRTAAVILQAQKDLMQEKNFKGDFAKAVAHQRFAKKLVFRRNLQKAAMHSRYARMLAFKVIRENKKQVNPEWQFTDEEKSLFTDISDSELQKEMERMNSKVAVNDEELVDKDMSDIQVEEISEHN
jgi:hypothetical protein